MPVHSPLVRPARSPGGHLRCYLSSTTQHRTHEWSPHSRILLLKTNTLAAVSQDIYSLFHLDRPFKFISKTSNFFIPIIGWSMFLTGALEHAYQTYDPDCHRAIVLRLGASDGINRVCQLYLKHFQCIDAAPSVLSEVLPHMLRKVNATDHEPYFAQGT